MGKEGGVWGMWEAPLPQKSPCNPCPITNSALPLFRSSALPLFPTLPPLCLHPNS
ncbi:MAG: hypothetical protein F6J93_23430 [Oscillatoria sp. SIO1A7]|nr:hypothetical protein [Oscillatoria sp. SIO1A7]